MKKIQKNTVQVFTTNLHQYQKRIGNKFLLVLILLSLGLSGQAQTDLTISGITAFSKDYDGTADVILTGTETLVGVAMGDDVSIEPGSLSGVFEDINVGAGKNVFITGTLTGLDAGNYNLIPTLVMADINPLAIMVTGISADNKTYDGTTDATLTGAPVLQGVIGADNVLITLGDLVGNFDDANAGSGKNVTIIGTLIGTDAGNYNLIPTLVMPDIYPLAITVTGINAANKTYDGTTVATLTGTPVLQGVIGADNVTITLGDLVGNFDDANAGSNKNVTVTATLTGADAGNYTLLSVVTANINAANHTINFTPVSDQFTTNFPFVVNATASSGEPITYFVSDGPANINGDVVTLTGEPGTVTLRAESETNNYLLAFAQETFEVFENPLLDIEQPAAVQLPGTGTVFSNGTILTAWGDKLIFYEDLQGSMKIWSWDGNGNLENLLSVSGIVYDGFIFQDDLYFIESVTYPEFSLKRYNRETGEAEFISSLGSNALFIFNEKLFFDGRDEFENIGLWSFDGTNAVKELDIIPQNLGAFENTYIMSVDAGVNGAEPYIFDGETVTLLADINPAGSSNPFSGFEYNGRFYFMANDGTGLKSYVYDPDSGLTIWTTELSLVALVGIHNGKLYLRGDDGVNGAELWVYDDAEPFDFGVNPYLIDVNPGNQGSNASQGFILDGKFYFQANPGGTVGTELVIFDDSLPVQPGINPGLAYDFTGNFPGGLPSNYTEINGIHYIGANANANLPLPWVLIPKSAVSISGSQLPIEAGSVPQTENSTDFGNIVSGTEVINTFTVKNNGYLDLSLTEISMPTGDDDFTFSSLPDLTTPLALAPFESVEFEIAFNPATVGEKTAAISITTDDAETPVFTFDIAGRGSNAQTVDFDLSSLSKTYGDAPFQLEATASSGLPTTFTLNSGPAMLTIDQLTINGAGTITLTASQSGNADYAPADVMQTLEVSKAELTITAADISIIYGDNIPVLTSLFEGFVNDEDENALEDLEVSTTATDGSDAGEYEIVSMASSNNYEITTVNGTLTIEKAPAEVTFTGNSTTYNGNANPAGVTTVPADLPVEITYNGATNIPVNAGTYEVVATVSDLNYTGSSSGIFTINRAATAITFSGTGVTFNGNPQPIDVIITPAGVTVEVIYDGGSTVPVNAGTYEVTATVSNPNYTGTASGTFVINKATHTLAFTGIEDQFNTNDPFTLSATVSSGLDIVFSVLSGPAAVSGNQVTLTGELGTVTIRATSESDNYLSATAEQSFDVLEDPVLGLEPEIFARNIRIYPVPAQGNITIESGELEMRRIWVLDINGKMVEEKSLENPASRIDLEIAARGEFLVFIQTNRGAVSRKIIRN